MFFFVSYVLFLQRIADIGNPKHPTNKFREKKNKMKDRKL
jgi:hypothetical protein